MNGRVAIPPEERFWPHVDRRGDAECWPWTGSMSSKGYGAICRASKFIGAHRLSWEIANGSRIPSGKVICHSCDNPKCVNPSHLLLGTQADNVRDMYAKGRGANQLKTHCPQGHEYTPENTYVDRRGIRHCRACPRERYVKRGGSNAEKTHCKHGHEFTPENTRVCDGHRQCRMCDRLKTHIKRQSRKDQ